MAYPVQIRSLFEALGTQRVIADSVEAADIHLGDQSFVAVSPAQFELTLVYTGSGVVASGTVRATFRTECARCLCPFDLEVTAPVDSYFVPASDDAEVPEEQEREHIVDDLIDLEPVVLQALVVELPFAPLHSVDCAGICPTCGADLNEGECGCEPEVSDSPFAALKDVLREDGHEGGGDGVA